MLSRKIAWCFLLFWGLSCIGRVCNAQNFSKLFDFANNEDAAANICIKADGSYFITGSSFNQFNGFAAVSMIISADGSSMSISHMLNATNIDYFMGSNGAVKPFGSGYVAPLTLSQKVSNAGIVRYNGAGDTIFTKTYTDTTKYTEGGYSIAILPDSSFLICGERDSIPYQISWGYIQHISSSGQLLWTKTYMPTAQIDTNSENRFISIEALPNHNILVGGMARKPARIQGSGFHFNHPWMLLLDSSGNILKDTMYSDHYYPGAYIGGGNIFSDVNGGYFHWGGKDSTPIPYPASVDYLGNYPFYIAHLDTNFKMEWRLSFPADNTKRYANVWQVIQTRDSGYLVMGSRSRVYDFGWLSKLDKHGKVVWEHFYYKDSTQQAYLVDAEERDGGGYVAVGWTKPCSTCSQDVWLLSVDSNGCELPGCNNGLAVAHTSIAKAEFELYPNPTTGAFIVNTSQAGQLFVYNLQGMKVAAYPIQAGKQSFQLSVALSAGVYIGQYSSNDGKTSQVVRIVYQP